VECECTSVQDGFFAGSSKMLFSSFFISTVGYEC